MCDLQYFGPKYVTIHCGSLRCFLQKLLLFKVGLSEAQTRKNSELQYVEPHFMYLIKKGQFVSCT